MKPRIRYGTKKNTVNFFGSLGYLFCCLQWLWAAMLYIDTLRSTGLWAPSAVDTQAEQLPTFTFMMPGPLEIAIMIIITVVMVGITAYALMRMPMGIVKTSNKIVHKTAETAAPVIMKAQHKKDTKKTRAVVTSRLMLAIKTLLVVIAMVLTVVSGLLEKQSIGYSIAMIIGGGLATLAVGFFIAQYALAGLLRTKMADLW